jgi:Family of unknown function (DUF6152)
MRFKRIRQLIAVGFVLVLPMLSAVSAHHSAALFEDKEIAAKGVVADITWRNPHVLLYWDVKNDKGQVVRWVGEMASVTSVMADGLRRDSLKSGEEIIITFRPARAGTPESVIGSILRPNGTIVLPWGRQGGGSDEDRAQRAKDRAKLLAPFGIKVTE